MEKFNCIYCGKTAQDFSSIIDHNIIHHSDQELKIIKSKLTKDSKIFTSTRTFGIITQAIINDRKLFIPNNTTKSLKISRLPDINEEFISPQTSTAKR